MHTTPEQDASLEQFAKEFRERNFGEAIRQRELAAAEQAKAAESSKADPVEGPKFDILVARFPYMRIEDPDVTDWMIESVHFLKTHPRIGRVIKYRKNDTPIPMLRNEAAWLAKQEGCRFLLMVDADMKPDLPGQRAKFLPTALEFLLKHEGPAVVGAPYCGPPPFCNVYVFRWGREGNDNPNPDWKLAQYTREEAELWSGLGEVGALPTGLILIDTRAFDVLPDDSPYFYYEYTDKRETKKASTEDVTFTRDISLLGVPIYCAWDCWAGHHKDYLVEKPRSMRIDELRKSFVAAVQRGRKTTDALVDVELEDGEIVARGDDPATAHLVGKPSE